MRRRYVQINGELIEVGSDYVPEPRGPLVMPDIQPYRSMIDGRVINSRSSHREHLKAHGCVEVGNDSSLYKQPKPIEPPAGLKETIARQVYEKLRY